jgi:RNA-directed DNA polymerase
MSGPFPASVPHSLLLKAVAHHTSERWVLLYISRWLTAPVQMPDGAIVPREKGTPQGSPISPLLANLSHVPHFSVGFIR